MIIIYCALRWLPESASWLLTQGKKEEASKILHVVARANKTGLSLQDIEDMVRQQATQDKDDANVMVYDDDKKSVRVENVSGTHSIARDKQRKEMITSVIKYPILRVQIVIVMFVWWVWNYEKVYLQNKYEYILILKSNLKFIDINNMYIDIQ